MRALVFKGAKARLNSCSGEPCARAGAMREGVWINKLCGSTLCATNKCNARTLRMCPRSEGGGPRQGFRRLGLQNGKRTVSTLLTGCMKWAPWQWMLLGSLIAPAAGLTTVKAHESAGSGGGGVEGYIQWVGHLDGDWNRVCYRTIPTPCRVAWLGRAYVIEAFVQRDVSTIYYCAATDGVDVFEAMVPLDHKDGILRWQGGSGVALIYPGGFPRRLVDPAIQVLLLAVVPQPTELLHGQEKVFPIQGVYDGEGDYDPSDVQQEMRHTAEDVYEWRWVAPGWQKMHHLGGERRLVAAAYGNGFVAASLNVQGNARRVRSFSYRRALPKNESEAPTSAEDVFAMYSVYGWITNNWEVAGTTIPGPLWLKDCEVAVNDERPQMRDRAGYVLDGRLGVLFSGSPALAALRSSEPDRRSEHKGVVRVLMICRTYP